jgi:hypothetical protein
VILDLPKGDYSSEWMNIGTGGIEKAEKFHHAGGDKTVSTPNFENGIALRLNRLPL